MVPLSQKLWHEAEGIKLMETWMWLVMPVYKSSTWKVMAGESEAQVILKVHSSFGVRLSYVRRCCFILFCFNLIELVKTNHWNKAQEFTSLTSFQLMMLLVQGPHSAKHCPVSRIKSALHWPTKHSLSGSQLSNFIFYCFLHVTSCTEVAINHLHFFLSVCR